MTHAKPKKLLRVGLLAYGFSPLEAARGLDRILLSVGWAVFSRIDLARGRLRASLLSSWPLCSPTRSVRVLELVGLLWLVALEGPCFLDDSLFPQPSSSPTALLPPFLSTTLACPVALPCFPDPPFIRHPATARTAVSLHCMTRDKPELATFQKAEPSPTPARRPGRIPLTGRRN